jgi:hypothetical protein
VLSAAPQSWPDHWYRRHSAFQGQLALDHGNGDGVAGSNISGCGVEEGSDVGAGAPAGEAGITGTRGSQTRQVGAYRVKACQRLAEVGQKPITAFFDFISVTDRPQGRSRAGSLAHRESESSPRDDRLLGWGRLRRQAL